MKILVTGSTGLLGDALIRELSANAEAIGLSRHAPHQPLGKHVECELSDVDEVCRIISAVSPDVVVHSQAFSDVDGCEKDPGLATKQNVDTLKNLCVGIKSRKALLIALSTDYVFDGKKGEPYCESDGTNPISIYGRSKLEAEKIALAYPKSIVVRPSTLFGPARDNFCNSIVKKLKSGETIEAFSDQTTSPTYTVDLAAHIKLLIDVYKDGVKKYSPRVFHITNYGFCTRVGFATYVADLLGLPVSLIRPVSMSDQKRPAPRPANSSLKSLYLASVTGRSMRSWEKAVREYLISRHWLS